MKRLTFLILILGGLGQVSAQTLVMNNGDVVPANGLTRSGDSLKVTVTNANGMKGQVGYPISDVQEIILPAPDDLKYASEKVGRGDFAHALSQIDPDVAYQKTLRDVPGNWWGKTALVEIAALLGLHRMADATALVDDIAANCKEPEILIAARLQIAMASKFDDPQQALAAYDTAISQSTDPKTLSQAWIAEGDVHFGQHEFADALLAYLTATVFFADNNPLTAKALWGAGRSYTKLKDVDNATKTYQKLIATYPRSPEAALAKVELQKKENKT